MIPSLSVRGRILDALDKRGPAPASRFSELQLDSAFRRREVELVPGHEDAVVRITRRGLARVRRMRTMLAKKLHGVVLPPTPTQLVAAARRRVLAPAGPPVAVCAADRWTKDGVRTQQCGRPAKEPGTHGPLCRRHAQEERKRNALTTNGVVVESGAAA